MQLFIALRVLLVLLPASIIPVECLAQVPPNETELPQSSICVAREHGKLTPGSTVRLVTTYSYVTGQEHYLHDLSCKGSVLGIEELSKSAESVVNFIDARDLECKRRGATHFCAERAKVDITAVIVLSITARTAVKIVKVHKFEWIDFTGK